MSTSNPRRRTLARLVTVAAVLLTGLSTAPSALAGGLPAATAAAPKVTDSATTKPRASARRSVPNRPDGKRGHVRDTSRMARASSVNNVDVLCMESGAGTGTGGTVEISVSDTEDFGMAAWGETVSIPVVPQARGP